MNEKYRQWYEGLSPELRKQVDSMGREATEAEQYEIWYSGLTEDQRKVVDELSKEQNKEIKKGKTRREFLKFVLGAGGAAVAWSIFGPKWGEGPNAIGPVDVRTPTPSVEPIKRSTSTPEPTPLATSTETQTPLPTETLTPVPTETPSPTPTVNRFPWTKEELVVGELYTGNKERRVVMMTYDDQGSEEQIDEILAAYDEYGVKATFFVLGSALKRMTPSINKMIKGGHQVSCHGYDHVPMTSLTDKELAKQFQDFMDTWKTIAPGYEMHYFRPPYGDRNKRVLEIAADFGLRSIIWSVSSVGMDSGTYNNVTQGVFPGSIVLCHMMRFYDVTQAREIVGFLVAQGYSVETVDDGIR